MATALGTGDPLRLARGVLVRHLLTIATVTVAILFSMLLMEQALTRRAAEATAERVAVRVAGSVTELVAATDFRDPAVSHAALDERLSAFLDAGAIVRIKVWLVEGEQVRVVYSDDPRVEGTVRDFSRDLAARLDAGETVILDVPDDTEHQFESVLGVELREAFIGFTDQSGNSMRLELYVPVHSRELTEAVLAIQLPVIATGLVLLVGALTWGSVSLARQLRLLSEQRHQAVLFGLRAREEERTDLARRLHDGVVQSLAGSRLALEAVRGRGPSDDAVLGRVAQLLGRDARELRALLAEYVPVGGPGVDLAEELRALADPSGEPVVEVSVSDAVRLTADSAEVIRRAAHEGVRNAKRHAGASAIRVSLAPGHAAGTLLRVDDDGRGMAEGSEAVLTGHVGLSLLRSSALSVGGTLRVTATQSGGTRLEVWVPAG